jgi:hypothetical protein
MTIDINILIAINTMLVPGIYWIGLHRVLNSNSWKSIRKTISIALVFVGLFIAFISLLSGGDRLNLGLAVSCFFPFYHLWFYNFIRTYFIKRENREPIDVALNFKSGLEKDRIFALTFVLFSIFSSYILIGFIIWNYNNLN